MSNTKAYITKRILVSKSTKAIQLASDKAMESIGYIVVAKDGWVVREFQDGRIERIEELEVLDNRQDLNLD